MTPVLLSGGGLVRAGGNTQPYPRASVDLSHYGRGVEMLGDGRLVSYADLYAEQLWVAVAVNKITRQIARLPLKVYKRTKDGKKERVRNGALPDLLGRPWPGAGATHLKQAIALHTLVHGNSAVRKVRDRRGGPPVELHPLLWQSLAVEGVHGGFVEAWKVSQDGVPPQLQPDDVIHTAWMGLYGQIGISPLRHAETTLKIEDGAQRWQLGMLHRGARPPSAVIAGEKFLSLKPAERQEMMGNLRSDIDRIYGGPDNSGRPAVLPPGVSWERIGHTAVEAELIEQRKLTREEVAAIYDTSPPMIGQLERSTFNNITELHRMLYVTVLGPWLNLIEETFKAQLIDPEPVFRGDVWVEFDLSEVLKGDLLARAQALALQIAHGILTIDEARAIENRSEFGLPETQLPLYPSNNLTPVGHEQPSDEQLQEAAKAIAGMQQSQIAHLLGQSSGSIVAGILAVAESDHQHPSLTGRALT